MEKMKYILLLCSFILGMMSCMDEDTNAPENTNGLKFLLSVPKTIAISPMSKSNLDNEEAISDFCILIYEKNNLSSPIKYDYFDNSSPKVNDLTASSEENPQPFNYPLKDGTYYVRVVVNAGDLSSMTMTDLDQMTFSFAANGSVKHVMYGTGTCTVTGGQSDAISIALKRIYSKITVKVNTRGLDANVTIIPRKVLLKHVPLEGGFFKNRIKNISKDPFEGKEVGVASDDDMDSDNSLRKATFTGSLEEGYLADRNFYMYENIQPQGTYSTKYNNITLSESTSPAKGFDKTPASFSNGPIADKATVMSDKTCSYIEVFADYSATDGTTGKITYRFFLGKNHYDNFEVERNYNYLITLNLGGRGAVNEVSWRVDTDLNPDFITSDVYIGYLKGSTADIKVEGKGFDIESLDIRAGSGSSNIANSDFTGSGKDFRIPVYSTKTNLRLDAYEEKYYTITARFKNVAKTVTKTVKVHQVNRLVDPIAIYKKAENIKPVDIAVREYTKGDLDYHTLSSNGPWSMKIESGDWFKLSYNDNTITKQGDIYVNRDGGDIVFTYTPKDENQAGDDRVGGARFGTILIKYHNLNCEHRIYLRQGYNPTKMVEGDATWSLFNCIGDGSNQEMTTYPTQTGYFYVAGNNKRIHPFNPGYKQKSEMPNAVSNGWGYRNETPCPKGYKLPTNDQYVKFNDYSLYQGFVYDDSEDYGLTPGWRRNNDGSISLEDNVNCNPAKGTLVIDNSGNNLFFPYGKGVMTSHNQVSNGTDIQLDEIGIGGRLKNGEKNGTTSGFLAYGMIGDLNAAKDRYGAFYFTNTGARNYSDSYKRVDFWYDMTDPNQTNAGGTVMADIAGGYGSFVRCIRDGN